MIIKAQKVNGHLCTFPQIKMIKTRFSNISNGIKTIVHPQSWSRDHIGPAQSKNENLNF